VFPTPEATQGQMDGFFSQLTYECHLEEVASVGHRLYICPQLNSLDLKEVRDSQPLAILSASSSRPQPLPSQQVRWARLGARNAVNIRDAAHHLPPRGMLGPCFPPTCPDFTEKGFRFENFDAGKLTAQHDLHSLATLKHSCSKLRRIKVVD